ncbi:MAG: DUF4437 domain-containing protein, partial [Alphaproteobacteria bacterium]
MSAQERRWGRNFSRTLKGDNHIMIRTQVLFRTPAAFGLLGALLSLLWSDASAGQAAFDPDLPVAKPRSEIPFAHINEAIQMGPAWGDRALGAHGTFGKFPANFITPVHTHTHAYHGIVLRGVMTNPFGLDGEKNPPRMATGSYWYVPAGVP